MERAGIANASRAAVADEIESELVEIFLQPGLVEIIRDHARARRERRFHSRIDLQSALDRFLCQQAGGKHHAWVACVRAAGDRRDQNSAVTNSAFAVAKRIS